jgi:hypothetical protein
MPSEEETQGNSGQLDLEFGYTQPLAPGAQSVYIGSK